MASVKRANSASKRLSVNSELLETNSFISLSSVDSNKSEEASMSSSSTSPLEASDEDDDDKNTVTEHGKSAFLEVPKSRSFNGSSSNHTEGTLASSRNSSTSSLAALGITIPSHAQFRSFVHKHEIPRKLLHVSIGFITLWLYTIGVQLDQVTPVLVTMLAVIGSIDFFRLRSASFNALYVKYCGFLMREREVDSVNGVIYYLLGLIIVFLLYPKDICLLAVLLLSWADTSASTFGRTFGHLTPKFGKKSLAGSLAAFVTGVLSCWLIYTVYIPKYNYHNRPGDISWSPDTSSVGLPTLMLISGVVGAVSEAIDYLDDNLTIPVISGTLMWAVIKYYTVRSYDSSVFA